jgi:hypothetical protein
VHRLERGNQSLDGQRDDDHDEKSATENGARVLAR